jgi:hypothetical protein
LDARLTTFLYDKFIVAKFKEVKSGWSDARQTWQNPLGKAMFTNDDNDLLLWMVKHAEGFK